MKPPSAMGVVVVFRYQMRNRNAVRDLAWTFGVLLLLLAISAALQRMWEQNGVYSGNATSFLLNWLTTGAMGAALLLLPCAAALGAGAVPPTSEFESTQSALLTRLTAFDLAAGRLFAGLWPLVSALLASLAFWLAAQLGWRFVPGAGNGYGPIFTAHCVLLSAVFMVGAVGFLFATRRRPGRNGGRGTAVALVWAVICVTGILLANPWIIRLNDPARLINMLLLFNPVAAAVTAFGTDYDLLRAPWLYDRANAHDYLFAYPPPFLSVGVFLLIGLAALSASAIRLRRAYR